MPVIVVAPSDELVDKTLSNMQEVAARGGKIILITDAEGAKTTVGHGVADIIVIPHVVELRRADPGDDPGAAAGLSYGGRSWAPTWTSQAQFGQVGDGRVGRALAQPAGRTDDRDPRTLRAGRSRAD
jgi:hypothetical protein